MLLNFEKVVLTSNEKKSYTLITIFVLYSLCSQTYGQIISPSLSISATLATNTLGLLGILLYKNYTNNYIYNLTKVLFSYLLFIGILQGFTLTWAVMDIDMRYSLLFLSGALIGSTDEGMTYFHNLMKVIGIISIFLGVLGIQEFLSQGFSIEVREGTWTQSYFYWWASSSSFAYWGYYALYVKKEQILGYGVVLFYFILGMLFLKRVALLNVAFMAVLYVITNKNNRVRNLFFLITGVAVVLIMLYKFSPNTFESIWSSLTGRFQQIQDENQLDRAEEAEKYFKNANILQIFFGNGMGHLVPAPLWQGETILSLHMGWYQLIFKGGIFYLIYFLYIFYKIIKGYIKATNIDPKVMVCFGVSISFAVSLCFEGGWGNTLVPFCTMAPLIYAFNNLTRG